MAVSRTEKGKARRMVELDARQKHETTEAVLAGATKEQLIYSRILNIGRKVGLAGIITAFVLYVSGALQPKVPLQDISNYWGLSASEFTKTAGIKSGWAWLGMYNYGDMLSYFGIAVLGLISVFCYIAIIPNLIRKKDFAYVVMALLEVGVLVMAASGIIQVGE